MVVLSHPKSLILLGWLAAGFLIACPSMALAQGVDPLDTNNERNADPFSERGANANDAFFDMMHRVQLGNIRSVSEFGQDQQNSIGTEAADFRARQQELLRQREQPSSAESLLSEPTDPSVPLAP